MSVAHGTGVDESAPRSDEAAELLGHLTRMMKEGGATSLDGTLTMAALLHTILCELEDQTALLRSGPIESGELKTESATTPICGITEDEIKAGIEAYWDLGASSVLEHEVPDFIRGIHSAMRGLK